MLRAHGRCDVLVHAAAAFDRADLATLDLAAWRRVQAVNVEAALLLAQAFVPGMAARRFGRIIFVVSDTVWSPPAADMLAYVTSKGALIALAGRSRSGTAPTGSRSPASRPGSPIPRPPAATCRSPRSSRSGRGRRCRARWYPATSRPRWRSSPRMRRAALTGQTLCVDGGLIAALVSEAGLP